MTTEKSLGPDELVAEIAETLADYRRDEGVLIRPEDVAAWVDQFDPAHRRHVLRETHAVIKQRYFSKADTADFLERMVRRLAKEHAGGDIPRFLGESAFLDLQEDGKSQKAMLALLHEVIDPHGMKVAACGGDAPKRFIYLDDVLCTGNSAFLGVRAWWLGHDAAGLERQRALPKGVNVIFVFLALHAKNWRKVQYRFHYDKELLSRTVPSAAWRGLEIQNQIEADAALDFAFPRRIGLPPEAEAYFAALGVPAAEVFRPDGWPKADRLFTSAEGRDVFERALVANGLEIIDSLATHKANMHPLGYTLPRQKSLGFGALVFTWRNVPNNSPLVFWHDASIWTPLFKKRNADPLVDLDAFFRDETGG